MNTDLHTLASAILTDVEEIASDVVAGERRGRRVEIAYVSRGAGSHSTNHTVLRLPGEAVREDLYLHLEPQRWEDVEAVRRGQGTDVVVGDPAFDRAFLVEAGPASVVRGVLTPEVRSALLDLAPLELYTHEVGLTIERDGWRETARSVARLADALVAVADAVHLAFRRGRGGRSTVGARLLGGSEVLGPAFGGPPRRGGGGRGEAA